MQYFTILKYKLHSLNIQDDRTTRGLIAKPLKKIQNHRYGQPVASFGVFEWTLRELLCNIIKNLSGLFLFSGFITMCNLQKRLICAAFWVLLQAMFMNDWKQTAQRLKLQERLLTINKRNVIRWNKYRDKHLQLRRQALKWVFRLKA